MFTLSCRRKAEQTGFRITGLIFGGLRFRIYRELYALFPCGIALASRSATCDLTDVLDSNDGVIGCRSVSE